MNFIKNYFHLEKLGTNVRTEFIAGLTTFIIFSSLTQVFLVLAA